MHLCRPALDIQMFDGKLDIWKEEGDKEGTLGVRSGICLVSLPSPASQLVSGLRFWHLIRQRQLDLASPRTNAQSNTRAKRVLNAHI